MSNTIDTSRPVVIRRMGSIERWRSRGDGRVCKAVWIDGYAITQGDLSLVPWLPLREAREMAREMGLAFTVAE